MDIKHRVGTFELTLLCFAVVITLSQLSGNAWYNLALIPLSLLVLVFFFIPLSLVIIELTTAFPSKAGIYEWISKAFGEKWGFLAAFWQVTWCFFWYPPVLAVAIGYIIFISNPAFAANRLGIFLGTTALIWLITYLNCRGVKASILFSMLGVCAGSIFPAIVIIGMAVFFLVTGHTSNMPLTWASMIPNFSYNTLPFLIGFAVSMTGMQITTSYIDQIQDPASAYPRAFKTTMVTVPILYLLSSLAVAILAPASQLEIGLGYLATLEDFLAPYSLDFFIPIISILLVLGIIALVNTWVFGGIKTLLEAGKQGNLPPYFQKLNQQHMPSRLLVAQGVFCTLCSAYVFFAKSINAFYWTLYAISTLNIMPTLILIFLSAIKLRYTMPEHPRPNKIRGGKFGVWVVSTLGLLSCIFITIFGPIPPSAVDVGSLTNYTSFIFIPLFFLLFVPLILYSYRTSKWKKQ